MMAPRTGQRGFSLVELMVALVIGLVLMLTISTMVSRQESVRRGVTSGNDLTSNTAYAAYMLDRQLRSAGSGFSQNWAAHYGCPLVASLNNAQILPAPQPFPAPFAAVPQAVALAPLVVHPGAGANGSDVIAVMTGNSALSESTLPIAPGSATVGQLNLPNTMGMRAGDLVVLSHAPLSCMLQQVASPFVGGTAITLPFGGAYYAPVINGTPLTSFGVGINQAQLAVLGNVTINQPRLMLIGVRADATLVSYDLLQLSSPNVESLVEGVVDMRVRYGINTTLATGKAATVDAWVMPGSAGYDVTTLQAPAGAANLASILAVQVSLVMRSDLVERSDVTPATLTLFANLPQAMQQTYTVPAGTTNQRYRVVEFTVPLRNHRL